MKKAIILSILMLVITTAGVAQTLTSFTSTQQSQLKAFVKGTADSVRKEYSNAVAALPKMAPGDFTVVNGTVFVNFASITKLLAGKADTIATKAIDTRLTTAEKKIVSNTDTAIINSINRTLSAAVKSIATKTDTAAFNILTTAVITRLNILELWRSGFIDNSAMLQKIDAWIKLYSK